MANIVFKDGVDEIIGSVMGVTFDKAQAGNYAKKRPSPINHLTNDRMRLRTILARTNAYYWSLTGGQKTSWGILAAANDVTGPFGMSKWQAGCAMFFKLELNAYLAGDGFYATPPPHNPGTPPTHLNLARTAQATLRATVTPSAQWVDKRIYLRQALPGPGVRRWGPGDGYIAEYSELSPASPHDFTTHFQHLTGWHGRYWIGCQRSCGCRSAETLFDL